MNHSSDPNPGGNNGKKPNRPQGRPRQPEGYQPMEDGVLPEDFGRRLERLKEASGLSWRGLARALGVDPKRLGPWRKGVEPCGGAMHSIHRFGYRMPGGQEILMGEDCQPTFFDEEEDVEGDDADVNVVEEQEVNEEDGQGAPDC